MEENDNLDLSKKFFEKSLTIEANNFHGRLGLANFYFRKKDYTQCDIELQKITNPQFANDIRCLKLKADNCFQRGLYNEALDNYQKCKNVESPFKNEVMIGIGNCYFKKDDYRNATITFEALDRANPKDIQIKINLAACYMMRGRPKDAIKVFMRCKQLDPNNWGIRLYLAKVYMQTEEYDNAVAMIKEYINNNQKDYLGHLRMAELYEHMGALQSALEEIEVDFS